MASNPIGIVICRIAAIWLSVTGLVGIAPVISALLDTRVQVDSFFVYAIVSVLVPLISAFVLWHYAEGISSTRFGTIDPALGNGAEPRDLLMVGTQLLGIWVLVSGIVAVTQTETVAWMQGRLFEDIEMLDDRLAPHTIGARVSNAVRIVLGLGLIVVGSQGLRQDGR